MPIPCKLDSFHSCMIAGTHSSVGKTTVMLALGALARKKGRMVQPFKAGPDYIDPGFHHLAGSRKCRNLDLYLLTPEAVQQSFARNSQDADLSLVEGMMGLFDGKNVQGGGSSAEIAKLLELPVILIVDGSGLAGSAAAIVLGFQKLDPDVKLAGVIFNRVNHEKHYQYIKNAVEVRTGVACLGFLPREENISIPERHLGLTTAVESEAVLEKISSAAALLENHLDWDRFWEITARNPKHESQNLNFEKENSKIISDFGFRNSDLVKFRIGIAYDQAFSFYYEDNFDLLKAAGAEICFFSPLQDRQIPEGLDILYFGGGFPEIYALALAANHSMMTSIRNFYLQEGGFIYAECGGLMYLAETFCDREGKGHAFTGLIPGKIQMTHRLQNFGYHELETAADSFLFPAGRKLRSHEFHYSQWDAEGKQAPVYKIKDRAEGFAAERLLASYQHLYLDAQTVEYLKKNLIKRKVTL